MTNHFEILDLPCSLLLDPSVVESAWETATREDHPDLSGNDTTEANQARSVLGDPVTRLEHWLELRGVEARRDQTISPQLMDLFATMNPILADADSIIDRMQKASSALGKALLAKEAAAAQLKIQNSLGEIMTMKLAIIDQFGDFEAAGESGAYTASSEGLAQLKFLKKWEQQGQARLLTLLGA